MSRDIFEDKQDDSMIVLNNDDDKPEWLYSKIQNRTLSLIPHCVAPLSLLGSSLIIAVILLDRLYRKSTYHRIMLGLSICDTLSSLGLTIFGAWSTPTTVEFVVGARASNATLCDIAGFLLHMSMGTMWYTASLMVYFILLIRLEWKPEQIAHYIEPLLHTFAVGVTVGSGIYAVVNGYMNPIERTPGICWISSLPPACEENNIPCERGEGAELFETTILGSSSFGTFIVLLLSMGILYRKVWLVEKRMVRYLAEGQACSFRKSKMMALRGMAYIGAFFVSFAPVTIFVFIPESASRAVQFCFALLVVIFMPLQGLFNAIIYLYPQHHELTQEGHSLHRTSEFLSSTFATSRHFSLHSQSNTTFAAATAAADTSARAFHDSGRGVPANITNTFLSCPGGIGCPAEQHSSEQSSSKLTLHCGSADGHSCEISTATTLASLNDNNGKRYDNESMPEQSAPGKQCVEQQPDPAEPLPVVLCNHPLSETADSKDHSIVDRDSEKLSNEHSQVQTRDSFTNTSNNNKQLALSPSMLLAAIEEGSQALYATDEASQSLHLEEEEEVYDVLPIST